MSEETKGQCRKYEEDIWSAWPRVEDVPRDALRHAEGCPSCRAEIEALSLSLGAAGRRERGLAWSEALGARWGRLASRTRSALERPKPWGLYWAPAFAVAVVMIWKAVPVKTPVPAAPPEVLGDLEFFENLELLEHWEAVQALPAQEPKP